MTAPADFANSELDAIDGWQLEVTRDSEENPLFQDFLELAAAGFQRRRVRVDTVEAFNLAVERGVLGENLVLGVMHRGVYVLSDHPTSFTRLYGKIARIVLSRNHVRRKLGCGWRLARGSTAA